MSAKAIIITCTLIHLLIQTYQTQSVSVSPDGANLFITQKSAATFNATFDVAPAAFGFSQYSGSVTGILVLPANVSYHKECPTSAEPLGINPYIRYIQDWFISTNDIKDYILIIDRLDCPFIEKVEHAQLMGASGTIICDWRNENLFSIWAPQDWKDDIHIPTVLLSNNDCAIMMQHIGVQNWNPSNPTNMKYPTPSTINWTIGTIKWGLPHPNDKVEWQFWTSSNDHNGSQFRRDFDSTAIVINQANDTVFTPHMYILNGSHWGCDTSGLPCKQQCTNSGRYCATDPEYDLSIGLNGIDVVQENLRSLCVWEYDKANFGKMNDVMWWNYSLLWDENCGILANDTINTFNELCSYTQMDKLDTSGKLKSYVQNCITSSGGYGYNDGANTILNREVRIKTNSSINSFPIVVVNDFQIHTVQCKPPITKSSCEVLAAICNDFINGTQPNVCFNSIGCDGISHSNKILNPCGVCASITDTLFNDYGKDCRGICPTSATDTYYIDNCGQCLLPSDTKWNDCLPTILPTISPTKSCDNIEKDCAGNCFGNRKIDSCGQCLLVSDVSWNNCIGCDGVVNSGKVFNSCGYCISHTDANFDDYGKDCRGICSTSATDTYYIDECGECLLRSDLKWNECLLLTTMPSDSPTFGPILMSINTMEPTVIPTTSPTQTPSEIPTKITTNEPTTDPTITIKTTSIPTLQKSTTFGPTEPPIWSATRMPTFRRLTRMPTPKPTIRKPTNYQFEPSYDPIYQPTERPIYIWSTTTMPTFQRLTHMPTPKPTIRKPTNYQFEPTYDPIYSYMNYPTVLPTRNVEKQTESVTSSISMVMVLLIVIGALVLLLCLCGGYILYAKYKKNRNMHLDYIQNIISVEGEGDINIGEQDY
eukprot:310264_1